ncbi:MAG: hypothetical protein ABIG87_01590 [Patescibacteria group bacterium]
MGSNSSRIIASAVLFLGIFILPWWVFVIFSTIMFFKFPPFYTGLCLGLVADLLYSVQREIFFGLPIFFISFVLIFLARVAIEKQFRI